MTSQDALMEVLRDLPREELELYAFSNAVMLRKTYCDLKIEADGMDPGDALGELREPCEEVASTVRARVDRKLAERN